MRFLAWQCNHDGAVERSLVCAPSSLSSVVLKAACARGFAVPTQDEVPTVKEAVAPPAAPDAAPASAEVHSEPAAAAWDQPKHEVVQPASEQAPSPPQAVNQPQPAAVVPPRAAPIPAVVPAVVPEAKVGAGWSGKSEKSCFALPCFAFVAALCAS